MGKKMIQSAYRLAARLYPAEFRREFGAELQETIEATESELRELPFLARQRQRCRELGALVRTSTRLRFLRFSGSKASPPAPRSPRSNLMETTLHGLRYAFRSLARTPGFSALVVLTLAIGIGASTAIFSIVDAVLLQPLPYAEPDRLVVIWRDLVNRGVTHYPAAAADLADYREQLDAFEGIAGVSMFAQPLTDGDGDPERVRMAFVTANFFAVLGVEPMLGRGFEPLDMQAITGDVDPDNPPVLNVVLSHGIWQRRYGGDPSVLGRSLRIGGGSATVVGVMPPGFRLLAQPAADLFPDVEIWAPSKVDLSEAPRTSWDLHIIGRLKPGASIAGAQAELDALTARQRQEFSVYEAAGTHGRVVPMHDDLTGDVRPVVLALFGAVGFVLLIACVNVANLLLVRGTGRLRDISVRTALGASRARLVGQMLAESLILAVLSAALGLLLAAAGIRWLLRFGAAQLPRLESVTINAEVLGFTLFLSLLAAVVFGVVPALQASTRSPMEALKGQRQGGGTVTQRHTRAAMVVAEVALALVLLIGAGLMVRSFVELQKVDLGFDAEGVLTFQIALPFGDYDWAPARAAFKHEFGDRIRALPGVRSAAAINSLPLTGMHSAAPYGTDAMVADGDESDFQQAHTRRVLPGYFETMKTQVLAGRSFTTDDSQQALARFLAARRQGSVPFSSRDTPGVAIIDDLFAARAWPGEKALGQLVYVKVSSPAAWFRVIGIVEHQRQISLTGDSQQNIYFPDGTRGSAANMMWTVRVDGDPTALIGAIRDELAAIDPLLPLARLRTMADVVNTARAPMLFAVQLMGVFALFAVGLALLGLYAVLAYSVRQRTAEIGIRMAFGAGTTRIRRLVIGDGMRLAAIGVVVGLAGAALLTRAVRSMLVGVTPTDPATYAAIAVSFLLVAMLACYIPARRATQVDPMVSLRNE